MQRQASRRRVPQARHGPALEADRYFRLPSAPRARRGKLERERNSRIEAFTSRHPRTMNDVSMEERETARQRGNGIERLVLVFVEDRLAHPLRIPLRVCIIDRGHTSP